MRRLAVDERSINTAVDTFVAAVNAAVRSPKFEDEVTPSVGSPSSDDPEMWDWSIKPWPVSWLVDVEPKLPRKLPAPLRALFGRFIFPEFEWRPVLFFANTPEKIKFEAHEFRVALFKDRALSTVLLANGYIQFGQPATGSYDPVCLAPAGGELRNPVVRLDHEEILMNQRVVVVEVLAPSFLELVNVSAA